MTFEEFQATRTATLKLEQHFDTGEVAGPGYFYCSPRGHPFAYIVQLSTEKLWLTIANIEWVLTNDKLEEMERTLWDNFAQVEAAD